MPFKYRPAEAPSPAQEESMFDRAINWFRTPTVQTQEIHKAAPQETSNFLEDASKKYLGQALGYLPIGGNIIRSLHPEQQQKFGEAVTSFLPLTAPKRAGFLEGALEGASTPSTAANIAAFVAPPAAAAAIAPINAALTADSAATAWEGVEEGDPLKIGLGTLGTVTGGVSTAFPLAQVASRTVKGLRTGAKPPATPKITAADPKTGAFPTFQAAQGHQGGMTPVEHGEVFDAVRKSPKSKFAVALFGEKGYQPRGIAEEIVHKAHAEDLAGADIAKQRGQQLKNLESEFKRADTQADVRVKAHKAADDVETVKKAIDTAPEGAKWVDNAPTKSVSADIGGEKVRVSSKFVDPNADDQAVDVTDLLTPDSPRGSVPRAQGAPPAGSAPLPKGVKRFYGSQQAAMLAAKNHNLQVIGHPDGTFEIVPFTPSAKNPIVTGATPETLDIVNATHQRPGEVELPDDLMGVQPDTPVVPDAAPQNNQHILELLREGKERRGPGRVAGSIEDAKYADMRAKLQAGEATGSSETKKLGEYLSDLNAARKDTPEAIAATAREPEVPVVAEPEGPKAAAPIVKQAEAVPATVDQPDVTQVPKDAPVPTGSADLSAPIATAPPEQGNYFQNILDAKDEFAAVEFGRATPDDPRLPATIVLRGQQISKVPFTHLGYKLKEITRDGWVMERVPNAFPTLSGPAPVATQAPKGVIPVQSLKRSKADVAGEHYRSVQKEATAAGEKLGKKYRDDPTSGLSSTPRAQGARIAGKALARIGKEEEAAKTFAPGYTDDIADLASLTPEQRAAAIAAMIKGETGGNSGERGALEAMLALRMAGGLAGGAYGAATGDDPQERITRALIMGGLGAAAPDIARNLPDAMRALLLARMPNLAINALGGPYGSAVMGSAEHALADTGIVKKLADALPLEGENSILTAAGRPNEDFPWAIDSLKASSNPLSFLKGWWDAGPEATRLAQESIERGEISQSLLDSPAPVREVLSFPGRALTRGDISARNTMTEAGAPEEVARAATLTDEPSMAFAENIINFKRGRYSPIGDISLLFARTLANSSEGMIERTPILGALAQYRAKGDVGPDPKNLIVAQQILGTGVPLASAVLGMTIPPSIVQTPVAMKLLSNLGGQYGGLAVAGFALGQALRSGHGILEAIGRAATEMKNAVPLPSMEHIQDMIDFVRKGDVPSAFDNPHVNTILDYFLDEEEQVPPSSFRYNPEQ